MGKKNIQRSATAVNCTDIAAAGTAQNDTTLTSQTMTIAEKAASNDVHIVINILAEDSLVNSDSSYHLPAPALGKAASHHMMRHASWFKSLQKELTPIRLANGTLALDMGEGTAALRTVAGKLHLYDALLVPSLCRD